MAKISSTALLASALALCTSAALAPASAQVLRDRIMERLAHWAPRGYVFVTTNYRMLPEADVLEQARDVARATAFVQQHAADWGADPTKLILMGHSAGAHLVALVAAAPTFAAEAGAEPWLATISLDSGALDVGATMSARHFKLFDDAFGADARFWQRASPHAQLDLSHAEINALLGMDGAYTRAVDAFLASVVA